MGRQGRATSGGTLEEPGAGAFGLNRVWLSALRQTQPGDSGLARRARGSARPIGPAAAGAAPRDRPVRRLPPSGRAVRRRGQAGRPSLRVGADDGGRAGGGETGIGECGRMGRTGGACRWRPLFRKIRRMRQQASRTQVAVCNGPSVRGTTDGNPGESPPTGSGMNGGLKAIRQREAGFFLIPNFGDTFNFEGWRHPPVSA